MLISVLLWVILIASCKRENRENGLKDFICLSTNQNTSREFSNFDQLQHFTLGLYEQREWLFFDMSTKGHTLHVISSHGDSLTDPRKNETFNKRLLKQEARGYEIMQCIINTTPPLLRDCKDTTTFYNKKDIDADKIYFSYSSGGLMVSERYNRDYYINLSDTSVNPEVKEFAKKIYCATLLLRHYPSVEIPMH